ncbi:hypothetical protein GNAINCEL_00073 [Serratia phage KKP 3709]|nr:hypothetical protein GNAINCEL_00073 [Serratia phage KKP 3709]
MPPQSEPFMLPSGWYTALADCYVGHGLDAAPNSQFCAVGCITIALNGHKCILDGAIRAKHRKIKDVFPSCIAKAVKQNPHINGAGNVSDLQTCMKWLPAPSTMKRPNFVVALLYGLAMMLFDPAVEYNWQS